MEYQKRQWRDRSVEFPGRRDLIDPETGGIIATVDVARNEGLEYSTGDLFSSPNQNDQEERIADAVSQGNMEIIDLGARIDSTNESLERTNTYIQEIDQREFSHYTNLSARIANQVRVITIPNTGWDAANEGGAIFYRRDTGIRTDASYAPDLSLPTYVIAHLFSTVVSNNIGGAIYVESPTIPNVPLTNAVISLSETRWF